MTTTNDIIKQEPKLAKNSDNQDWRIVSMWRKVATLAIAEYHNQALCEFNEKGEIVLAKAQNDMFADHDEFAEDDEGDLDIPNYMYFKSDYFKHVCELASLDYGEVIDLIRERL